MTGTTGAPGTRRACWFESKAVAPLDLAKLDELVEAGDSSIGATDGR